MSYLNDQLRSVYLNTDPNVYRSFSKDFKTSSVQGKIKTKARDEKIKRELTHIAKDLKVITPEFKAIYSSNGLENLLPKDIKTVSRAEFGALITDKLSPVAEKNYQNQGGIKSPLTPDSDPKISKDVGPTTSPVQKIKKEVPITSPISKSVQTTTSPPVPFELEVEVEEDLLIPQTSTVNKDVDLAILDEQLTKLSSGPLAPNTAINIEGEVIFVKRPPANQVKTVTETLKSREHVETVESVKMEIEKEKQYLNKSTPSTSQSTDLEKELAQVFTDIENSKDDVYAIRNEPGAYNQQQAKEIRTKYNKLVARKEEIQSKLSSLLFEGQSSDAGQSLDAGESRDSELPSVTPGQSDFKISKKTNIFEIMGTDDSLATDQPPVPPTTDFELVDQPSPTDPLGSVTDSPFATDQPKGSHPPKYHLYPIKIYLGSDTTPEYDQELESNIYSSKISKQEIIDNSDTIISTYGDDLFISSRKSDTLDEMHELTQLMFCLKRNLQRGTRSKQAMVPISSLVDFANKLAGTDQSVPVDPTTLPQGNGDEAAQVPGSVGGSASLSSEQVQLSPNKAFDKIVEEYRSAPFTTYGNVRFNNDLIQQTKIHSVSAFKGPNSLIDVGNNFMQGVRIKVKPAKKATLNY